MGNVNCFSGYNHDRDYLASCFPFFSVRKWTWCGLWDPSTCEESAFLCLLCAEGTVSRPKNRSRQLPCSQESLLFLNFNINLIECRAQIQFWWRRLQKCSKEWLCCSGSGSRGSCGQVITDRCVRACVRACALFCSSNIITNYWKPQPHYWNYVCVGAGAAKVSQVKPISNGPKALIIEPSKELAEQTLNNVKQFKKYVENPKLRHGCTQPVLGRLCLPFVSTRWRQTLILNITPVFVPGSCWWLVVFLLRTNWLLSNKGYVENAPVSFFADGVFPLLKWLALFFCSPFYLPLVLCSPLSCDWLHNQIDIVVGTPGRLDDLISTGKLTLSQVRFLVLDECVCAMRPMAPDVSVFLCLLSFSLLLIIHFQNTFSLPPSGWPPVCRLYRLYQQDPQPNPSGDLWWKEAAGNTHDEFVCNNKPSCPESCSTWCLGCVRIRIAQSKQIQLMSIWPSTKMGLRPCCFLFVKL